MRRHSNRFLIPIGLFVGLIVFLLIGFAACDKHKYSRDDKVTIIATNKPIAKKDIKKGIVMSEEELDESLSTIAKKGLLDVTTTPR